VVAWRVRQGEIGDPGLRYLIGTRAGVVKEQKKSMIAMTPVSGLVGACSKASIYDFSK
jgi:hypothetical protein